MRFHLGLAHWAAIAATPEQEQETHSVAAASIAGSSFTLSRDRTGAYGDRTGGTYELQYTTTPGATFDTPDDAWCTAGTYTRNTHTLMGFWLSPRVTGEL